MLAKGAFPCIAPPFIAGLLLYLIHPLAALPAVAAGIFVIVFFRDPRRRVARGVCAAADGKISQVLERDGLLKISTFMNIHNVHVNRAPLAGTVKRIRHRPGGHRPAFDKDSHLNERVIIDMETAIGPVRVIQIAGAFARRIVPYIKTGTAVSKGQKIGLIRFGSRVDVILPAANIHPDVRVGDRVRAGESCLAARRG